MNPLLDNFQTLARYNAWMNGKIYEVCARMPDDERKIDRGAWFKSVHGTLNHLLLTDNIWLGRFHQQPFLFQSLDQELFANFDDLRRERAILDARILRFADDLTPAWLEAPFHYSNSLGEKATYLTRHLVLHFFNHQTHHRGQLTTLMEQMGYDSGVTDLRALPGLHL